MKIWFGNVPASFLAGDLLQSLLFDVQNAVPGESLEIEGGEDREKTMAFAAVTVASLEMPDYQSRRLALSVLWFFWRCGLRKETCVEIRSDQGNFYYGYDDFPELASLFFPSQS